MTFRTSPELWQPPVQGVKALPTRKPSRRALMAQTQSAVALQLRYERWITWHYSRILNDMRRAFVALDHIPDDLEAMTIIAGFQQRQEEVLQRMFLQIYPQATAMVMPDDALKSYRRALEVKALSPEQQRILEQIQQSLGSSVSSMSSITLQMLMELRDTIIDEAPMRVSVSFFPDTETSMSQGTIWEGLAGPSRTTVHDDQLDRFIEALESSGAFSPARARRIAVTETNEAVNRALAQAAQEATYGEPMVKEWSTWQDSLVRRTHRVMHGKVVDDDEMFEVPNRHGGTDLMMWPGDRAHGAGPENYINCRCKCFHYLRDL